jgi:hypothetical protein
MFMLIGIASIFYIGGTYAALRGSCLLCLSIVLCHFCHLISCHLNWLAGICLLEFIGGKCGLMRLALAVDWSDKGDLNVVQMWFECDSWLAPRLVIQTTYNIHGYGFVCQLRFLC